MHTLSIPQIKNFVVSIKRFRRTRVTLSIFATLLVPFDVRCRTRLSVSFILIQFHLRSLTFDVFALSSIHSSSMTFWNIVVWSVHTCDDEQANIWCVSNLIWVAYCTLCHRSRLFYVSLSVSSSKTSFRNSITHIFSPVLFFIVILKKRIENEAKNKQQTGGRSYMMHRKNGQNWCVCTIFIKRSLNIHEKNTTQDDDEIRQKEEIHVLSLCVLHGTLALKTKTNTENNIQ